MGGKCMEKMRKEWEKEQRRSQRIQKRTAITTVKETPPAFPQVPSKAKTERGRKMKCGACGQLGHTKRNKACPMYKFYNQTQTSVPQETKSLAVSTRRSKKMEPLAASIETIFQDVPVARTSGMNTDSEYPAGFNYDLWKSSLAKKKTKVKAGRDDKQAREFQMELPAGFNFDLWNTSTIKIEVEDWHDNSVEINVTDPFFPQNAATVAADDKAQPNTPFLCLVGENGNQASHSRLVHPETVGLLMDFKLEPTTPPHLVNLFDDLYVSDSENEGKTNIA